MVVVLVVVVPRSTYYMLVTFEVSKFNGTFRLEAPQNMPLEVKWKKACEERRRQARRERGAGSCCHARSTREATSRAHPPSSDQRTAAHRQSRGAVAVAWRRVALCLL